MATMLDEIVTELMRPPGDAPPIKAATLRRWMRSSEGEARGAVCCLLTNTDVYARVTPPLSHDEAFDWLISYYAWCLRTNPRGEWSSSRFEAASDMLVWFVGMWDEGRDRSYFVRIKELLADLYLAGSPRLKQVLVQGCLEHLFEREEIMDFFQCWKDDPQLAPAYEQAFLWVLGGGTSPWTRPRKQGPE
jgi:hypothetical protein